MQYLEWVRICLKRFIKNRTFIFFIILIPLLSFFITKLETEHTSGVEVGLLQSSDPVASKTIDNLLKTEGMFKYKLYENEEEMADLVRSRKLEAAIAFSKDLKSNLEKENFRGSIILYRSPSSITDGVVAEDVFAKIIDSYLPYLMENYIKSRDFIKNIDIAEVITLNETYRNYKENNKTFKFDYEFLSGKKYIKEGIELFPLKGLISIFIMLTSWISTLLWYRDNSNGIYNAFSVKRRKIAGFISTLIPSLILVVVSSLVLGIKYGLITAIREFIFLTFYGIAVSLFLFGSKIFFKKSLFYASIIPVAVLGSLAASPVIVDLSKLLPSFSIIQKLFLPSYYLGLTEGLKPFSYIGLVIISILGIIMISLDDRTDYSE